MKSRLDRPIVDTFPFKLRHKQHLLRLRNVKSKLNQTPVRLLVRLYLRGYQLRQDFDRYNQIARENRNLLVKLRSIDYATTTKRRYISKTNFNDDRIATAHKRLSRIESENIELGCRLLTVKSKLNTRSEIIQNGAQSKKKPTAPLQTVEKYINVLATADVALVNRLLRPLIYFDLEIRNVRPLGRITLQLHTEACPELVLEFIRMCTHKNLGALHFIRVFPALWVEGELAVYNECLSHSNFQYEMNAIDHSQGPGVMSFSKRFLEGFPAGLLNFSISFKAMPILNDERIAFGTVSSGLRVLDCLQDFGTRNGKMIKDIIAVQCGVY